MHSTYHTTAVIVGDAKALGRGLWPAKCQLV